jgi:hypothetical protein
LRPGASPSEPGAAPKAGARLGVDWQELPGNPLLAARCFTWRCAGVTDPAIDIRADGSLDLWFTTMGIRKSASGLQADGPWIGHATVDPAAGAKAIVAPESPVVGVGPEGTWDRYVETVAIAREHPGARRVAVYLGYAERGGKTGFVSPALGLMRSDDADGAVWTRGRAPIYRPPADAWDGTFLSGPSIVRGPDNVWRLYYTGAGGKFGIGLLTSIDGERWTPHESNPVLEAQPGAWDEQFMEACVIYHRQRYSMWYAGWAATLNRTQPSASVSRRPTTAFTGFAIPAIPCCAPAPVEAGTT